jgi:hypothetical protein
MAGASMKTEHRNITCRFELDLGYGMTKRAVEYNLKLHQLGLIIVNEITFICTGMEVISRYCYCSRLLQ